MIRAARRRAAALRWLLYAALVCLAAAAASPAAAQTEAEPPYRPGAAGPSPELERALRDARERGSVIIVSPDAAGSWDYRALDADADAYDRLGDGMPPEMRMLDQTQSGVAAFYDRLGDRFAAAPGALDEILSVLRAESPNEDPIYFAWVLLIVVVGLIIGFIVEKFVYGVRLVGPWFIAQQQPAPRGFVEKVPILALRVALSVGGLAISCTVALLLGLVFYEPHVPTQKTALIILITYAVIRIVDAIWRMALSPYLPNYRIPKLDDRCARVLYRWMMAVSAFAFASLSVCLWFEALGLDADIHVLMTSGATLLTVLLNLALISANRAAVSGAILAGGGRVERASVFARVGAALWAPLASLYLIVAWAEMTYRLVMDQPLGPPLILGAYGILTALLVTYAGIGYLIEWVFQRRRMAFPSAADAAERATTRRAAPPGVGADAEDGAESGDMISHGGGGRSGDLDPMAAVDPATGPMFEDRGFRMRTMEDLARRVASILALSAGLVALLWIWNAEVLLAADGEIATFIDFAVTLLVGYIAYHAIRIAIDQRIEEEGGADLIVEPGGEGGEGAAASRLATLLPLFRNFLLVTIAVVTIMMLLLESGVNVTPLFAGAGVVGLAIGFGAQTLVRDIFSGAFFLIDDAFRKGEYIDIGEVKGTVEKISVRSFQLRHHLGYLHTIPFGEIQYLTNYSRDWVMMKLPLRLTYDTDIDKVRKLIKKLGQDLLSDPEIGDKFMQPLKSQGVYMMEESAMILRVKFMCRPGEQWVIRKKVYSAIRELFEREGVRFAHREVTVHVAGEGAREMSPEAKGAVAGAARPLLDPAEGLRQPAAALDER